ncbi:auxin-responsive protein IAA1-like [Herrania umbratica]|uniref:Auxin-responsive protein n=1 Tax=Herrania umbratica TaxID=108875 RepID=A0A6J0ZR51_9ROSI|nr:auxin-responsive protein IAA1-like [Herrania umbratica]
MSLEETPGSPESDVTSMSFEDTELTLGLPGEGRSPAVISGVKCSAKRGFIETVDLKLGSCSSTPSGRGDAHVNEAGAGKPPPAKAQVIGWPPVRSCRKKAINDSCKYVKVAVDGAPYLRKANLGVYSNYHDLMKDLENLFTCRIIRKADREESKVMDAVKGMEYVPTYEDKDGDWMLVGDVPWKMFIESCKRIRLMKSSEAAVLAPKASLKCSGTC